MAPKSKSTATTVNLTLEAQVIKDDIGTIYGLKNILSVGMLLFAHMQPHQREAAIKALYQFGPYKDSEGHLTDELDSRTFLGQVSASEASAVIHEIYTGAPTQADHDADIAGAHVALRAAEKADQRKAQSKTSRRKSPEAG